LILLTKNEVVPTTGLEGLPNYQEHLVLQASHGEVPFKCLSIIEIWDSLPAIAVKERV
jgi:hypothetical protein